MDIPGDIPKQENQITKEWVERNTGFKPLEGTINVKGNIQAGFGFLSNLCRVSFKTVEGSEQNILVKLLPESEFRAITINQKLDQNEINFYSLIKPQLVEVWPELKQNLCEYYGGRFIDTDDPEKYGSMLIMQDLKPLGYEMLNPEENEHWRIYLEDILKFLAEFHAAGFVLQKRKGKTLPQIFPFLWGLDDSNVEVFVGLALTNAKKVQDVLEKFNCPDGIKQSLVKAFEDIEKLLKDVLQKGSEFPCMIHGDLWPPNVMVKGPTDPIKVIDWQLIGFRDAAFEISVAILTCMKIDSGNPLEPREIEKFAKLYYQHFLKVCGSNGLDSKEFRSEPEFLNVFKGLGMKYAFLWFVMSSDAYENDQEKLYHVLLCLQEKYKVAGI